MIATVYKKQKLVTVVDIEETDKDHPDLQVEISIDAIDAAHVTRKLVARLNEHDRLIIELRYWSELPFREIGMMLSSNEQAIRVRHHRILEKLKKLVQKDYE